MSLKETALEVLYSTVPIIAIITILQFTIVKLPSDVFGKFIGGAVMVILGLILFQLGVNKGFLPMGEMTGAKVVAKGNLWLILGFGLVLGFAVTVAEPDLQVLASQVDAVSGGQIGRYILLISVALGVGIYVMLALLRIFLNIPFYNLLLGSYGLILLLSFFTPPQYLAVSLDSGGVTTGPMTVPFILALGVGVAASVRRKGSASEDSFGFVALASAGPILAVLLLGVIYQ
jgi:hypothetical protein